MRTKQFREVSWEIQTFWLSLSQPLQQHSTPPHIPSLPPSLPQRPAPLRSIASHAYSQEPTSSRCPWRRIFIHSWVKRLCSGDYGLCSCIVMRGFCCKKTNKLSCLSLLWRACACRAGPGRVGPSSACVLELRLKPEEGTPRADYSHTNNRCISSFISATSQPLNHGCLFSHRLVPGLYGMNKVSTSFFFFFFNLAVQSYPTKLWLASR